MKKTSIVLLIILCNQIESSFLDIQDLTNNPGMFAIQIGTARIIEDYHLVIHRFDIGKYESIVQQYKNIIYELDEKFKTIKANSNKQQTLADSKQISDITNILKQKYEQTYSMVRNFKPIASKPKRAIDILGTVIKTITGNLDHNDYVDLSNKIDVLRLSTNKLITENNAQITINSEFEQRLNNITDAARTQAQEIHDFIRLSNFKSNDLGEIQQKIHLHNVIFSLDNIREQLNVIFESVQLAKLGILSKALLFPTEMNFIMNILLEEGLKIKSYDQAYEYLEPIAIHHNHQIHLLIKIPKLRSGSYSMLRIEPIPINQSVIHVQSKYAVINKHESYLIDKFNLIEGEYILKQINLQNVTNNQCEHQLFRANHSKCVFTQHDNYMEVTIIENYGVLIKNAQLTTFGNTCGYGKRNLTGTFFVYFKNCTISVDKTQYGNKQMEFEEQPKVIPLNSIVIETNGMHFDAFQNMTKLHIDNREKITKLEKTNTTLIVQHATSLFIIIILILLTAWCSLLKIHNLRKRVTITVKPQLTRDGSI
ncbi:uncharacterized protein LOC126576964 isoform X2 [Anopheles aquasalis]|nr:uncharacterized protein LOC126576964 isoform X2 [Anopheles aquasalis]